MFHPAAHAAVSSFRLSLCVPVLAIALLANLAAVSQSAAQDAPTKEAATEVADPTDGADQAAVGDQTAAAADQATGADGAADADMPASADTQPDSESKAASSETSDSETESDSAADSDPSPMTPDGETPPQDDAKAPRSLSEAADSDVVAFTGPEDPEFVAEWKKREDLFNDARSRLEAAVLAQRATYLRYLNYEERTPAARKDYFEKRQKVRDLMDEVYLTALDLARLGGDEVSATYLVTMIDHRLKRDIYDVPTLEGASRMIDGGSQLTILFKAAARSAVVSGEFEMARKLLEAIEEDQRDEVDRSLLAYMDEHEEAFNLERERSAKDESLPLVKLETTQGDVLIELYINEAPSTVSNFIQLVEEGFYDGLDFYQVIDHLLALTGDPSGVGNGGSGKHIMDEHSNPDARRALRGSLLMAKLPDGDSGDFVPHSASSQFAILLMPVVTANENQTVFGRVIEGMDAIARMRRVDPNKEKKKDEIVIPADSIIRATVVRRPETLPPAKYLETFLSP
ncbi:putative peptidyl-prolyl cis-trans isomerase [Rubripirellula lacrimiformis]|uniref:peptidylprolyl isomerase n=1 Tax=Rubripirellula lacrimiformis TaxID=1930273 RepID=A0A517NC06_9BACT|nr:peptidylprolyl isomerase [Rubripirellula lacrimiformis]QDT04667.1 putative peptidyl-prolyl cis-trans isomerase [Rubripirellula lacrimiformis]